jgi:hypothetical protein
MSSGAVHHGHSSMREHPLTKENQMRRLQGAKSKWLARLIGGATLVIIATVIGTSVYHLCNLN